MPEPKVVMSMAILRVLSAAVEITAALLMLHWGTVARALRLNAALGLFGPLLFMTVSTIGLVYLADRLPLSRLILVVAGVTLVFIGTRS